MRRDAFLTKVLEVELDYLEEEVSIPNSQASYDFVLGQLKQLGDRKLVSFALPPELIARLNDICSRKRIVRDAFFNRLFLLLAASPKVIDALLFEGDDGWRNAVWSEHKHDETFFQNGFYPLKASIDPFWAIRAGIELASTDAGLEAYVEPESGKQVQVNRDITDDIAPAGSLYTTVFEKTIGGKGLLGFCCHLPDWRIPTHKAAQDHRAKLDELLEALLVDSQSTSLSRAGST